MEAKSEKKHLNNETILEQLNWRYATKAMSSAIVPQEKINAVINATLLCPTSSGLQPFELLVIGDAELKKKILPIAMNQRVIT